MPSRRARGCSSPRRFPREGRQDANNLFSFLRGSHIFSSAVREALQTRLVREAFPQPLTPTQSNLLRLLAANGHHAVGHVAHLLGVSAPAATKTIDKLERLGLVERTRSTGDRRTTLLSATTAGREGVRRFEELKAARLARALEGFRHEEVEALSRLLTQISVSLLGDVPVADGPCLRCAAHVESGCPIGQMRGGCPYQVFRGGADPAIEERHS